MRGIVLGKFWLGLLWLFKELLLGVIFLILVGKSFFVVLVEDEDIDFRRLVKFFLLLLVRLDLSEFFIKCIVGKCKINVFFFFS